MPNIKSAIKRMRQNEVRRDRNRSRRGEMRTYLKRFRALVAQNELDQARAMLPEVYSVIDRTSQKGLIHPNAAARHKSRLSRLLAVPAEAAN